MTAVAYTSSLEHLLAELERIELLVRAQIVHARSEQQRDKEFRGLYISEEEIDALLNNPTGYPRWAIDPNASSMPEVRAALKRLTHEIDDSKVKSIQQGVSLRLEELQKQFQLTPFDIDTLLVCLAPELDLRYERLYAYLQDDVTKKRPSVDLVLNLLCRSFEEMVGVRQRFSSEAPLLSHRLVRLFDDSSHQQPPLLSKYIKVEERVASYLLGSDDLDPRLERCVQLREAQARLEMLLLDPHVKDSLGGLIAERRRGQKPDGLVLYFQGPYGVGKRTTAEALCHELGTKLLIVDLSRVLSMEGATAEAIIHLVGREALLQKATVYWSGFDALLADDKRAWREALLQELEDSPRLTFLGGETTWEPADVLQGVPFIRVEFPRPTDAGRIYLWKRSLNGKSAYIAEDDLSVLASKFRLSGGQIRDAARTACNLACWRDPVTAQVTIAELYAACRLQSNRKLATLAKKITPHYRWHDIILPPDRLSQLREICNYMKYRSLVYDEWGFDSKLSLGKGLNALFSGPSGTGKTMAAEIVAGELGLDLYKIDLSSVVSKYIGETEKNLSRIFTEAETSNAILFFDEADALFGKRSEVRDSHDRYANIEISYLLQRMEEYEGLVILATNLRKNMDDAFVRRMHFAIDFPFPTEKDRRRIWDQIWPAQMPREKDIDLDVMARRFEMAGGNLKNVALAAAFLAADDGKVVTVEHLLRATRREYQKMGKVVPDGEFARNAVDTKL